MKDSLMKAAKIIASNLADDFGNIESRSLRLQIPAEKGEVEEFLRLKQNIMLDIASSLPLSAAECPFCIEYTNDCKRCPYGKVHGLCVEGDSTRRNKKRLPDYAKIITARDALKEAVYAYYSGESYE